MSYHVVYHVSMNMLREPDTLLHSCALQIEVACCTKIFVPVYPPLTFFFIVLTIVRTSQLEQIW